MTHREPVIRRDRIPATDQLDLRRLDVDAQQDALEDARTRTATAKRDAAATAEQLWTRVPGKSAQP